MTSLNDLETLCFNKKAFFDLKAYFLVLVSLLLAFFLNDCTVSELKGRSTFGSIVLNMNLFLNSGTELWLGQIQWCRSSSRLNIGEGYVAILAHFQR